MFIFLIIGYVLFSISLYKVFEKVGEVGWKGLVFGFNFVVWCKLVGRLVWYVVLMFFLIVNFFIYVGLVIDMVCFFDKNKFWESVVVVVFIFFYFFYLGFIEKEKYIGLVLIVEKVYMEKLE